MKKFGIIALVLVLTVSLLAGCRSQNSNPSTNTTPSTNNTVPSSTPVIPTPTPSYSEPTNTMPSTDMDELIPGTEDTIDPSNGANKDDAGTNSTDGTGSTNSTNGTNAGTDTGTGSAAGGSRTF